MKIRSELLVLVGFSLIAAVGLLVLWSVMGNGPLVVNRQPEVTWQGLAPRMPLAEAARRAEERARAWASDAELVWVKGSWRPQEHQNTEQPPIAWTLHYYSPSRRETASVTVKGENLFWIPPRATTTQPAPLAPFPPAHGIEVAWMGFRAAGGNDFLRAHPSALVQYRLQRSGEGLVWIVLAYEGEHSLEVRTDANSGKLLSPTGS